MSGLTDASGGMPAQQYDSQWLSHPDFSSSVDVTQQGYFDMSGTARSGGCVQPFSDVEVHNENGADIADDYETGGMVCWSRWICHLAVAIDTDGSVTPSDQSGDYDCTQCVGLNASANPGYDFDGWSGDVSSTDPTINVCMNYSDRSETAEFTSSGGGTCDPSDPYCSCDPSTGVCNRVCTDEHDPILIKLSSGDWHLSGLDEAVEFDMSGSGRSEETGWTARDSDIAFLVLDRNQNSTIDNGLEMFSNAVVLTTGRRAHDGFEALAMYDSNGDAMITDSDPIWQRLLLWTDRNHDGVSQPGELMPISASGVTAIELGYHWSGRRDQSGNYFRYEGKVHINGRVQPIYDVFFAPLGPK